LVAVFTANYLTDTDKQKQYMEIHKITATQKGKHKIQQNKTSLVQSPLTTLSQETRWAYSTALLSTHG